MKTDEKLKDTLVAQVNFWLGRSADNIQVIVEDGMVTLRGQVPGYEQKIYCIETVQRVAGVKAVVDEVVVELPETRRRTDAEIAAAAANAIRWITTVPLDSIKITVRAGMLILEGIVEYWSQRGAVEYAVRHLPGIIGISNLITARPQPIEADVKAAIASSLERHALLDANKIEVQAVGSKVILRGNISSIAERNEVERAARTARGVTDVANQIVVAA
ncbi:MAG TPA: BON domain-containing protein [Candidatus Sulfotelmatobacter sp.]|nr:BON domain-containing protein [Candidatus Sulfotelmatobacter sp.]